jgi:3-oxoadipate enol-lactonase
VIRLHHEVDGAADGPAVLMINSLGADLSMWQPQVTALGERHRVIRYDARGHGRSDVPTGPYTIEDLGRDAIAVLDALDVARAHVVGLSLGGMTAMWLAAHAPERVDRLVLCCTSARLGPPHQWVERARLVRAHGTAAVADTVVSRWLTPAYAAENPDDVATLRAMIAGTSAEGYAGACAAIQTMDQRADLPGIVAPTLVVAGAEDPATPPAHAELIAAAVPGATLAVVGAAAHLATWQHPDVVNPLILEALDGR